jgi:hypothetical protein
MRFEDGKFTLGWNTDARSTPLYHHDRVTDCVENTGCAQDKEASVDSQDLLALGSGRLRSFSCCQPCCSRYLSCIQMQGQAKLVWKWAVRHRRPCLLCLEGWPREEEIETGGLRHEESDFFVARA